MRGNSPTTTRPFGLTRIGDYRQARGWSYQARGDHERAIVDFSEAIRLKPGNCEYYESRAEAFKSQGGLR